mmetsp:Transcript_98713/g.212922  ORF Transcript_98713/g.212922 Transcript_98713/m.212922 type:complete len:209 (-) Transcript_98713:321-947(-)
MTLSELLNQRRISASHLVPHVHGCAVSSVAVGVAPNGHTEALSPSITRHRPERASRWIRAKSVSRLIGSSMKSASRSRWDTEEMTRSMPRCAALNMVIMWWHFSTAKMEGISVISSTATRTTVYVASCLEPTLVTASGERSSRRTTAIAMADMTQDMRIALPASPTQWATARHRNVANMPMSVGNRPSVRTGGTPMKLSCSSWCSCAR